MAIGDHIMQTEDVDWRKDLRRAVGKLPLATALIISFFSKVTGYLFMLVSHATLYLIDLEKQFKTYRVRFNVQGKS